MGTSEMLKFIPQPLAVASPLTHKWDQIAETVAQIFMHSYSVESIFWGATHALCI